MLDRFPEDLGDVLDADFLVPAFALHAVVEHDVAEGARDRDARRAGRDRLLAALGVHLLARVLLHPHARAAGTAAHPARSVARHLDEVDTGERADDSPGREVDVVVTAEITRVVVGHSLFQ